MSDSDYNFQKDLRDSVLNCDPKLKKTEVLEMAFKCYVAKMLEYVMTKRDDMRIEMKAMTEIRNNLISEFRSAELGEWQKSVEQYENLFDETIVEIFNQASHNHEGTDLIERAPEQLEINAREYINNGGLYIPRHLKS